MYPTSTSPCYQCSTSQSRNPFGVSSSHSESEEDTMFGRPVQVKSKWGTKGRKTFGSKKGYESSNSRQLHQSGGSEEWMGRRNPMEWLHVINLEEEGFSPEEQVKCSCKVDSSRRILLVKIKSHNKKVQRVVPIEDNIHYENLRVLHQPHSNQLIITAPYTTKGFSRRVSEGEETQGRSEFSFGNPSSHFPSSSRSYKQQQTPTGRGFFDSKFTTTLKPSSSPKSQVENEKEMQKSKVLEKTFRPECIRDESSGQLCVLWLVNTLGFSQEEIQVQVDEKEKLLIVEANKDQQQLEQQQQQQQQQEKSSLLEQIKNLPMKSLRREFILPEWVDVNKIGFRVMQNGLLSVKLPLTSSVQEELKNKEQSSEKGEQSQLYTRDWQKPLWG